MARIAGIDLPNKHLHIALTYIYGIGRSTAEKICRELSIDNNIKPNDLSSEDITKLRQYIENECIVEGRLRTQVNLNIKRIMDIATYKGLRHRKGLPVRGQRTQTNARTRKGKKKTVAGKKK